MYTRCLNYRTKLQEGARGEGGDANRRAAVLVFAAQILYKVW